MILENLLDPGSESQLKFFNVFCLLDEFIALIWQRQRELQLTYEGMHVDRAEFCYIEHYIRKSKEQLHDDLALGRYL